MKQFHRPPRANSTGVAIVEFALILPMLLLLLFLTAEFGRALFEYNIVVKAARDGARYLSTKTINSNGQQARNLVIYGNTAGTGTPLARGLSTATVPMPTWGTAGTDPIIHTATVTVTGYQFRPMVSGVFGVAFPATITFPDIRATMRVYP